MGKILRIDVAAAGGPKVKIEQAGEYAGLGGRALITTLICKEVPPGCHPLGPENKLVIAPGLMSGSEVLFSSRLSIGCKSPLTGTVKEINVGGNAARALGRLGYAAIIIEGECKSTGMHMVVVDCHGIKIKKANDFHMLPNSDLAEKIKPRIGDKDSLISIGTAGEMRMANSTIAITDMAFRTTRHAGRGCGAVMGSKGIKAIVVNAEGARSRQPANLDKFRETNRRLMDCLKKHAVTGLGLPDHHIDFLTNVFSESGEYSTCRFKEGRTVQRSVAKHDREGPNVAKRPEYEMIWVHGRNCGIHDLEAIHRLDFLYSTYGFDAIEMGMTLGVAMEAELIRFGDAEAAIKLVEEAGKGTPLGRILGAGTTVMAKCFGRERAPVPIKMAMPVHDRRALKDICMACAATAALEPIGYGLCIDILAQPDIFQALIDSINAMQGLELSGANVQELGKKILRMERRFNELAISAKAHDKQTRNVSRKPFAPFNAVFDMPDQELDNAYSF